MSETNVDVVLRDACFEAGRLGLAFDVAWCAELRGRSIEECVIPPALPVWVIPPRRTDSRGRLIANGAASPPPVAKDEAVTDNFTEKLMLFLAERLEPTDFDKARAIVEGTDDDDPSDLAQDSLRCRVAQDVTRQRAAVGTSYDKLFPNAHRLG